MEESVGFSCSWIGTNCQSSVREDGQGTGFVGFHKRGVGPVAVGRTGRESSGRKPEGRRILI